MSSMQLLSELNTQLGGLIERAQKSPDAKEKAAIFSAAHALFQHFEAMLALCEDPQESYLTRRVLTVKSHLYAAIGYAEPGVESLINASLAQNTLRHALNRKLKEAARAAPQEAAEPALTGVGKRPELTLVWSSAVPA